MGAAEFNIIDFIKNPVSMWSWTEAVNSMNGFAVADTAQLL